MFQCLQIHQDSIAPLTSIIPSGIQWSDAALTETRDYSYRADSAL